MVRFLIFETLIRIISDKSEYFFFFNQHRELQIWNFDFGFQIYLHPGIGNKRTKRVEILFSIKSIYVCTLLRFESHVERTIFEQNHVSKVVARNTYTNTRARTSGWRNDIFRSFHLERLQRPVFAEL